MKVNSAISRFWDKMYEHGDIKKIEERSLITAKTISEALSTHECSTKTCEAITAYFKTKQADQAALLSNRSKRNTSKTNAN